MGEETRKEEENEVTLPKNPQSGGAKSAAPDDAKQDDEEKNNNKKQPRRVIRRRKKKKNQDNNTNNSNDLPVIDPILLEKVLKESGLPRAYSFELEKSIQRILSKNVSHVALQMPEGLLLYATVLADVLKRLAAPTLQDVSILGDVTYGACCVGDLDAQALGAQLLIHYGHSCLVPLQHTVIPCLYVFVEIQIDIPHLVDCLDATIQSNNSSNKELLRNGGSVSDDQDHLHIYLLGTVQFRHALVAARDLLRAGSGGGGDGDDANADEAQQQQQDAEVTSQQPQKRKKYKNVTVPQVKPLSPGEVLGCTSPKLPNYNQDTTTTTTTTTTTKSVVCFVADGRFHLESTLISNPHIDKFYRYDPYGKTLTEESYDYDAMHTLRRKAIADAAASGTAKEQRSVTTTVNNNNSPSSTPPPPPPPQLEQPQTFGIILGTLGRQGNPAIVRRIQTSLRRHNKRSFLMLLSEITPTKLQLFGNKVDVWVQIACPRLSVDWGHYLSNKPVLTPYELSVCLEETTWKDVYPMDFYSLEGGPWSNYHPDNKQRQI